MGKEWVYRIKGIRDWDHAAAVERAAVSFDGVTSATVVDTGSEERWEFLSLDVSGRWNEESARELTVLLSDRCGVTMDPEAMNNHYVPDDDTAPDLGKPRKEPRKVSMGASIAAMAVAVVLAVLITFSLTVTYQNQKPVVVIPTQESYPEVTFLDRLFQSGAYHAIDKEQVGEALLNAYVVATGDRYAAYYNAEELKAVEDDRNGNMCGIGIQVVLGTVPYGDMELTVVEIVSVHVDSPAEKAGIRAGDFIVAIGTEEDATMVDEMSYTKAVDALRGEEGTKAEFVVWRSVDTEFTETLYFSIERKVITTQSVMWTVCDTDPSVGIIRISEFDNTTATQFRRAVSELKDDGCTSFVLDLRNNTGGLLTSVEDVLTYFLEEGDVMISTRDRNGNGSSERVTVQNGNVISGSRSLKAEHVGMYRDLPVVVLVNQYTASAAELFTANMRDYELAPSVGVTTLGKGSMQTTVSLERYGYEGALKMTVALYDPPSGAENNYDGIGITPDREVELSEEALEYSFNRLPHDKDNQLQEAIKLLK